MAQDRIEAFLRTWGFVRGMTLDFMAAVPDDKWDFSPHASYGPLNKQFRHMVWVSGLYNAAFKERKAVMARKKPSYSGSLMRSDLEAGFKQKDEELRAILADLRAVGDDYRVDFFGTAMTFDEFGHVMIEHEANHHGLWSLYAALAGFPTPKGWKDNWGL